MTTNQTEYLKDETGNRRWLPVSVVKDEADIEWLRENRDQLYAEAYYRVVEGKETVYEFPLDETRTAQEARRIHDPNSDMIFNWYLNKLTNEDRAAGITVYQVYRDVYNHGFDGKAITRLEEMSIADVLRSVIGLARKRMMVDGVRSSRWFDDEQKYVKLEIRENAINVEDVDI